MTLNFQKDNLNNYVKLTLSLIFVFWILSIYEVISLKALEDSFLFVLVYKLVNDFWCGLIIGVLCFPLFLFIQSIRKKIAFTVLKVIFAVLIIVQYSLIKYSLTTLINLGADLLGYSLDDISSTVSTSESASLSNFLPFVYLPSILFLGDFLFRKYFKKPVVSFLLIITIVFAVLKLVFSQVSNKAYDNKLAYLTVDIIKFKKEQQALNAMNLFDREDFPLLKSSSNIPNVLSPLINHSSKKPNIVFIVVEGLGSEFVDNNLYSGFTPYLDSLINQSLYWENFVSTTGRSFGILPSLFGSLPFAEKGFLEMKETPSHISLISILKANGYHTAYFSGGPSSFDRKVNFLEYNGVQELIDESKYGPSYSKTKAIDGGFSWGYPDHEIFRKTLNTMSEEKQPRLDIIMTLSSHEPFEYPQKEFFESKVDEVLKKTRKSKETKKRISENKDIFGCLLYTDRAIEEFMTAYKERPEYENTIFIITGDHRLIPIIQQDKLCRFHVPFLVYSKMLNQPKRFKSVSSHWDVTPSLTSFLTNNYRFKPLSQTAWMGKGFDTVTNFQNNKIIPLMRYKGSINDIIYKDYFYSDGELFKIKEDFNTYKVVEEDVQNIASDSLMAFKKLNAYVTQRNKIFPDSLNIYVTPKTKFSKEENNTINALAGKKTFDELFVLARDLSHKKDYKNANLLCNYILNEYPNYADVRILKARGLGWQQKYKQAEVELLDVLNRSPFYDDGYLALLDVYWWSNQELKSSKVYKKAIKNEIINPIVSFKMAKAYERLDSLSMARRIMDSLVKKHPNNSEFIKFKNGLKK